MIEVELKDGRKVKGYCECDKGHVWDSGRDKECFDEQNTTSDVKSCCICLMDPWFYPSELEVKVPVNFKLLDDEPKMLIKYIVRNRNKQKQKVGCLVGVCVDGVVHVGYSLCHPEDVFDKNRAKQIALGRAMKTGWKQYPASLKTDVEFFYKRCWRYFKEPELDFKSYDEVADERD